VQTTVFPRTRIELRQDALARLQQTTVLMTVHERLTADTDIRDLVKLLSLLAEVWVPCRRNRLVLVQAGMPEDRVHVIPHPYDPDDLPLFDKWLATAPKPGDGHLFQFLTVGKWEPRKAQHELIGGFLLAFKPTDKVRLAVKTASFGRWSDYPVGPVESVRQWLENGFIKENGWTLGNVQKAVLPIIDPMPREGLVALHCHADCYVSSSRSEGFDLSAFDAKLAGKRMLYVRGSGGPEDFAQPDDITVEPSSGLATVHPQYGWEGARWSGHTVADIGEALRRAYEARGGPAQERVLPSRFSPESVGKIMRERIEAIIERLSHAVADR
jgi:glycosyltransferase involved in cell wall biosynthesis